MQRSSEGMDGGEREEQGEAQESGETAEETGTESENDQMIEPRGHDEPTNNEINRYDTSENTERIEGNNAVTSDTHYENGNGKQKIGIRRTQPDTRR